MIEILVIFGNSSPENVLRVYRGEEPFKFRKKPFFKSVVDRLEVKTRKFSTRLLR